VPECTKLFKAQHFWRKHVEKRHPEWYNDIQKDVSAVIFLIRSSKSARSNNTATAHASEQLRTRSRPYFSVEIRCCQQWPLPLRTRSHADRHTQRIQPGEYAV
jgi:hypothetical protein